MNATPKMAESSASQKRKAQGPISTPADKKCLRSITKPSNSLNLENAFKQWEKNKQVSTQIISNRNNSYTPNLVQRSKKTLPLVDNEGFITPRKHGNSKSTENLSEATFSDTNVYSVLSDGDSGDNSHDMEMESQNSENENFDKNNDASRIAELTQTSQPATQPITPNEKVYRPPPILIQGELASNTVQSLKNSDLAQDDFTVSISKGLHSIMTTTQTVFEKVKTILKNKQIQFYTFTPKGVKPKSIILKGISEDFSAEQVELDLKSKNIPAVEILKVLELKYKRDNVAKQHLIVQISQKSSMKELFKIKSVLSLRTRWERLRRNRILQCMKCQRVGHTAANCEMNFRCLKCGESHNPGECPLNWETTRNNFKCANCGKTGHPANYAGCPFLKFVKKAKKEEAINKNRRLDNRIEMLNSRIRPQASDLFRQCRRT